ncbi:MAG: hypothetical protein L3K01_05415 [Thermoplasmata archaeon]|nr:hypothetical protein [Thermoplasmata archaeon]
MATLDGLLDLIWRKEICEELRELAREALRLKDDRVGDRRVTPLAASFGENWCRRRARASRLREVLGPAPSRKLDVEAVGGGRSRCPPGPDASGRAEARATRLRSGRTASSAER